MNIHPAQLANAITGFVTVFSGAAALLFCRYLGRQPVRWEFAYFCIFFTGIPTVVHHAIVFDPAWAIADIGTNLLLAWALQTAVLFDSFRASAARAVSIASLFVNTAGILWAIKEKIAGHRSYVIDLGDFGGFYAGETLLILDAILIVLLLYRARTGFPPTARKLLVVVTIVFLAGLYFASAADTHRIMRVVVYHSLWHILGGFGFLVLWAMNHVRFCAGRENQVRGVR